ncbi:MAG: adenylate kinase [Acutalibacteraceae bacterium]|nr:adenylate kinase [Acutalibacteraceae bacterium]
MKKAIIIGCPGSGKSTFAKKLHSKTDISLFHLDIMFWNEDKTSVDKSVFKERLLNVLQKNEWIIDGNYASTIELRLQVCDTVFFLDYPLDVCLEGVKSRRGKKRTDMPWVEQEDTEDKDFIEFIRNYGVENRPKVLELLDKYSCKKIYIFKSRSEANEFLNRL